MNIFRHDDLLETWEKRALKRYFDQRVDDYIFQLGIEDKKHKVAFARVCPKIMYDYLVCKKG